MKKWKETIVAIISIIIILSLGIGWIALKAHLAGVNFWTAFWMSM